MASGPGFLSAKHGALRHRAFRTVWFGSFASSLGGWMEFVGLQWAMAQATMTPDWTRSGGERATVMMGYLTAAQFLPLVLLGLWGGIIADRRERRNLLAATQGLRMIVAGALCVTAFTGHATPWALIALGALDGVVASFNFPAWQAFTPSLVPREDLPDAMALNGLQFNLARAVGPALGGAVLGVAPAWVLFLLNTLSFGVVMLCVMQTPRVHARTGVGSQSPWEQLGEALRFVRGHRGAIASILITSVFSMLATPMIRFMPIIVKDVYLPGAPEDSQERAFGFLLGMMGVGAVVGALIVRRIPTWYPKHHLAPLTVVLCACFVLGFALAPTFITACISVFLAGIFWTIAFTALMTALQLLVPDALRGRVLALCNTVAFGAIPLGTLFASEFGLLIARDAHEGRRAQLGMAACAAALVVYALWNLIWRTPEIDGMTQIKRRPGLVRGVLASAHRPEAQGAKRRA